MSFSDKIVSQTPLVLTLTKGNDHETSNRCPSHCSFCNNAPLFLLFPKRWDSVLARTVQRFFRGFRGSEHGGLPGSYRMMTLVKTKEGAVQLTYTLSE